MKVPVADAGRRERELLCSVFAFAAGAAAVFMVYISGANSKKMLSLRRSFVPRLLNCSQV